MQCCLYEPKKQEKREKQELQSSRRSRSRRRSSSRQLQLQQERQDWQEQRAHQQQAQAQQEQQAQVQQAGAPTLAEPLWGSPCSVRGQLNFLLCVGAHRGSRARWQHLRGERKGKQWLAFGLSFLVAVARQAGAARAAGNP